MCKKCIYLICTSKCICISICICICTCICICICICISVCICVCVCVCVYIGVCIYICICIWMCICICICIYISVQDNNGSTLTISSVSVSQSGNYTCKPSNMKPDSVVVTILAESKSANALQVNFKGQCQVQYENSGNLFKVGCRIMSTSISLSRPKSW